VRAADAKNVAALGSLAVDDLHGRVREVGSRVASEDPLPIGAAFDAELGRHQLVPLLRDGQPDPPIDPNADSKDGEPEEISIMLLHMAGKLQVLDV
jgi:hypothetical protein